MKKIVIAGALIVTAFASTAFAEGNEKGCTSEPKANWQSQDAMKAKAKGMGLDVRGVKVEGSCYEVYAMNKSGKKMEIVFNPVTLEQAGTENGE